MMIILQLLGALGMFLYGMNLMSAGLQKAAGSKMRNLLASMTSNPFKGVMTGLGVTSVIQSSSATTVMTVGFVNAGLLTLTQAIGVIMGANIGTTVTAWMVSLLGFKADISIFAIPLMAVGFILSLSKRDKRRHISELIIGFSLLFLGLSLMKSSVPPLNEESLAFIQNWTSYGFGSVLIFMVFGTVLTLVLQSSSATMALTLIMVNMGWIPFEMGAAMVLGENIGTTITANIAAAVGNANAKRAALAHTVFNLFGVVWALALFHPFLKLVGMTITWMGLPNPLDIDHSAGIVMTADQEMASLYGISMLHTLFNIINTLILVWFIKYIVAIVTRLIKDKQQGDEEDNVKLKFIDAGPLSTAELAVGQARNEAIHLAEITRREIDTIRRAVNTSNGKEFDTACQRLVKYEEISDRIEFEIAQFLNALPEDSISEETRTETKRMYRIIGELESLGDSGESISRILARRNSHNQSFTEQQREHLGQILDAVDKAYGVMIDNLKAESIDQRGVDVATEIEIEINTLRDEMREAELQAMERDGVKYQASVYYLDTLSEIERMGDYIINVSQALTK
ncbi:MAG: Na/Pi cotransporter family protein [Rikenellaceae bacterium]|nr:Na/Pi cotransporter family protein [Rikenellaceae bacterium]